MRKTLFLFLLLSICNQLHAQHFLASDDLGRSWKTVEAKLPLDINVNFIAKYDNKWLIGTENDGLFLDGQLISSFLPGRKVNGLLVDGREIFVSIYHHGLFKSENAGISWELLHDGEIRGLAFINEVLFIGADKGIYRKSEKEDWIQVFDECQVTSLHVLEDRLVAGTSKGILLSDKQGKTWKWIYKKGAVHNLQIDESRIYALGLNDKLLMSENFGTSWVEKSRTGMSYAMGRVGANLFLSTPYGIMKSEDSGRTWSELFPLEEAVAYVLYIEESKLYMGLRAK